ncbi:MAG: hypothetical protein K2Z81_05625 [Cyanobacteria bacterium]|nr:hypothetical protein [Cyanobacteriota bacterium]
MTNFNGENPTMQEFGDHAQSISSNDGAAPATEYFTELHAALYVRDHYSDLDKNGNGFISDIELLQTLSSTTFGDRQFRSLYAFEKNLSQIEDLSNDEWGRENSGISRKDLDKFIKISPMDLRNAVCGALKTTRVDLPDLTASNGRIIGAARAIRAATEIDHLIDTGTDEPTIFATLEGLSDSERRGLKSFYKNRYGIEREEELRNEMSGSALDHALNLLARTDAKADDAGFLHEILVERNQYLGRSRTSLAKTVRDKLSSMSSADLDAARQDYRRRYDEELEFALENHGRFDKQTTEAVKIYLKGSDHRTDSDSMELASLALQAKSLPMFEEAMRGASPQARETFLQNDGDEKMKNAFGGSWMNVVQYMSGPPQLILPRGNVTDSDYVIAKDFASEGRFSTANLIDRSTTWLGDNEKAIETTISQMSDFDRQLYADGKTVVQSGQADDQLSHEQLKAVDFYKRLHDALKTGGNATEMLMWEDQIRFKNGSLVTDLGRHNHFFMDSAIDDVLRTIENMTEKDWQRLKSDETFRISVYEVLNTFLSPSNFQRASMLIESTRSRDGFKDAQANGKRPILDTIGDNINRGFLWMNTKEENIWQALETMSEGEREMYKNDFEFAANLHQAIRVSLNEGAEQEIAFSILDKIALGEDPKRSIIERLSEYSTHWFGDEAKIAREVEKEFRENPALYERIANPATEQDQLFSSKFKSALEAALGKSDYIRFGVPLIERGSLPLREHLNANSGFFGVDEKGLLKSMTDASTAEKESLLSPSQANLKESLLAAFTDEEAQLALVTMEQGRFLPEDKLRAYVLGVGNNTNETKMMLTALSPYEKTSLVNEYSRKYGCDAIADFLGMLSSDEHDSARMLLEATPRSGGDQVSEVLRSYSHTRDGIGNELLDAGWDGTGYQSDNSLNRLLTTARDTSTADLILVSHLRQETFTNLENVRESKEKLAEVVTDSGIAVAAIAGSFFTAGTSLSLLAKAGIAGTIAAGFKVAGKSTLMGADYDWSAEQVGSDGARGFIYGATAFIGPTEIARVLGVGTKVAAEASQAALQRIATLATRAGEQLIREGSEEMIKQSFIQMMRQAIVSGTMHIPIESLDSLATQVATSGNQEAVKVALQISFARAVEQQASKTALNLATEYGVTGGSGALGGGTIGFVNGVSEWDSSKSLGENSKSWL